MDSALGALVVALLGVTFGWEPVDDGSPGYEYVVQLEPELVDVLQSGQAVPIESYVPAEVGQIRKVRIMVGKSDLPQTFKSGESSGDTIVRGQNDAPPQRYTALRESDGWTDNRYQSEPPAAWPTNTATAPAAAAWPQTTNDPRVAAAVAQQPATSWTGTSASMSPPPLLTPGHTPLAKSAAVSNELPLPSQNGMFLATPMSDFSPPSASATDSWAQISTAGSSLSLPDPSPTNRSQAAAPWPSTPGSQTAPAATGWDTAWPTSTASADSDLVPVAPISSRRQNQSAASDWSWPTDGQVAAASQPASQSPGSYRDDWPTTPPPNNAPLSSSPSVPLRSDWPAQTSVAAAEGWGDRQQPQKLNLPAPPDQSWPATANPAPAGQQNVPSLPSIANAPAGPTGVPGATPQAAAPQTLTAPQEPWLPLLLVSLGLAGSIGANFFLGWSYMDARQRYRSLVQKTSEVFHRVTGAAA
jgi:hypothetical protein